MYAHYGDIEKIEDNKVTVQDRNDGSEIIINIDDDEKSFIEKCKCVRLEFLKNSPEDDFIDKKGRGKISIMIDMDQIKLPDYKYTIAELMEYDDKTFEQVCKELELDPKESSPDDGDIVKEIPVPKKDIKKFKKILMKRIKEDIEMVMQMYEDGEIEQPNLDEAIDDCASEIYRLMEELSWDISKDVNIKVK